MTWRQRGRTAEALVLLVLFGLAIHLVPFRLLSRLAGTVGPATASAGAEAALAEPVLGIGRALRRAVQRLPWTATCLVQALAGAVMLRRRRLACRIEIGVAKVDGELAAHAWLVAGGTFVCGGDVAPGFTPLAALTSTDRRD